MTTIFLPSKVQSVPVQSEHLKDRVVGAWPGRNFKKMMETKLQEKKAKGLCFRCDENFVSDHRCKNRTLQILTMCDEEDDDGDETKGELVEEEE